MGVAGLRAQLAGVGAVSAGDGEKHDGFLSGVEPGGSSLAGPPTKGGIGRRAGHGSVTAPGLRLGGGF